MSAKSGMTVSFIYLSQVSARRRALIIFKANAFSRRSEWPCAYCGDLVTRETATVDHIVPRAAGGRNRFQNFTLSCLPCNRDKADRPLHPAVLDRVMLAKRLGELP